MSVPPRPDCRQAPDLPRVLYLLTDAISTRLLRGQLRAVAEAGFEVHLACGRGALASERATWEGFQVHELPFKRQPSLVADVRALAAAASLIRRLRPSLINLSTPKAAFIGTIASLLVRSGPRIYVIRGFRFETAAGWRRSVLRAIERFTIARADHVVFNSPSLMAVAFDEKLVDEGKASILGCGSSNGLPVTEAPSSSTVHDLRQRLNLREVDRVVGFVGRLTRDKGVVDLVQMFHAVAATVPDLKLLLVGSFEAADAVPASIRQQIACDDRIIHVDWAEDPSPYYAVMDVLVFPSYREGLPNVPLEAQAARVPVVGYASTGTIDAVRDGQTGTLVETGNVGDLSEAAEALLVDENRRRTLGAAGAAWVTTAFDQDLIWRELVQLYHRHLNSSAP